MLVKQIRTNNQINIKQISNKHTAYAMSRSPKIKYDRTRRLAGCSCATYSTDSCF